jgi:hypothetical protein
MVTGTNELLSITRDRLNSVMDQAVQWGADQELEASCAWLAKYRKPILGEDLKYVRRPKPPSLKEQALESLHHLEAGCEPNIDLLRRALEALPND